MQRNQYKTKKVPRRSTWYGGTTQKTLLYLRLSCVLGGKFWRGVDVQKADNASDRYAVAIKKEGTIVP